MGDGGFLFCMEKRGYVKAGQWTPEVTVEHPEAGKDLNFKIELELSNHIQFVLFLSLLATTFRDSLCIHFTFSILSTELSFLFQWMSFDSPV